MNPNKIDPERVPHDRLERNGTWRVVRGAGWTALGYIAGKIDPKRVARDRRPHNGSWKRAPQPSENSMNLLDRATPPLFGDGTVLQDDPRFEKYLELIRNCARSPEDLQLLAQYEQEESRFLFLLREAISDEETFLWYVGEEVRTEGTLKEPSAKAYGWHLSSQQKYIQLVIEALGALFSPKSGRE